MIVPTRPFAPDVQGLTWFIFIAMFCYCLLAGHAKAWLKTFTYLNANTGSDGNALTMQASSRIIWLYMFYAYTHAYVRIIFFCLVLSLVFIFLRLLLTVAPQDNDIMKTIVAKVNYVIDSRNVLEFFHFRHWRCHCCAFGIYLLVSLLQCCILFGAQNVTNKEEASRHYTRITTSTILIIVLFYGGYAAKVMEVSGRECFV